MSILTDYTTGQRFVFSYIDPKLIDMLTSQFLLRTVFEEGGEIFL